MPNSTYLFAEMAVVPFLSGVNYYPFNDIYGFDFAQSAFLENDGQVLQITATPEPASILLWLGIASIAFVYVRHGRGK